MYEIVININKEKWLKSFLTLARHNISTIYGIFKKVFNAKFFLQTFIL